MKIRGAFLRYQNMKAKSPQGQVATLFIVLIALVFIFMAITINIGKIANKKTSLDNAVDAAALSIGSSVASQTFALGEQVKCESYFDLALFLDFIKFVASVILFFVNPTSITFLAQGKSMFDYGSEVQSEDQILAPMNMENLGVREKIAQNAIYLILAALVNDVNKILDVNDLDRDENKNDYVSESSDWFDRHVATLESNVEFTTDEWRCFTEKNPGIACPDLGVPYEAALADFMERIDAGFEYCAFDADGEPRLDQAADCIEVDYVGQGDGSVDVLDSDFDYRAYFNDEFIPLLSRIMIRLYELGLDTSEYMPGLLWDNAGNRVIGFDEYNDPIWGTYSNQVKEIIFLSLVGFTDGVPAGHDCSDVASSSFLGRCGKFKALSGDIVTYAYKGLFREGECNLDDFDPSDSLTENCAKVDAMIYAFDDFLTYFYGLQNITLAGPLQDVLLADIFEDYTLEDCDFDFGCLLSSDLSCSRFDELQCPSSRYEILQDWQEQIADWRKALIELRDDPLASLIGDCETYCRDEICTPITTSTDCETVGEACNKMAELFYLSTDMYNGRAYDPDIEDCCKYGASSGVCSSSSHLGMFLGCLRNERLSQECYQECYNEEYWNKYPFDAHNIDGNYDITSSDDAFWVTCRGDTGSECKSVFYGAVNCVKTCDGYCENIYSTDYEFASSIPTTTTTTTTTTSTSTTSSVTTTTGWATFTITATATSITITSTSISIKTTTRPNLPINMPEFELEISAAEKVPSQPLHSGNLGSKSSSSSQAPIVLANASGSSSYLAAAGSSGVPSLNASIERALQVLGDPDLAYSGGLYWEMQALLDTMQPVYLSIQDTLDKIKSKATYTWKDEDGDWHMVMIQVGDIPLPEVYHTKSSSWLGLKKTECIKMKMEGGAGDKTTDIWAWRYDESKGMNFAGQGNVFLWKSQYGREKEDVNHSYYTCDGKPDFMCDDDKNNWVDLELLDLNSKDLLDTQCFLCEYGLRSHVKVNIAKWDPADGKKLIPDLYIKDTDWADDEFCETILPDCK